MRRERLHAFGSRQMATRALLACGGLVAVLYAGSLVIDAATHWLARQSEYQIKFREITLSPPPPAWFVGGSARFLDRVRQEANESETMPLLELYRSHPRPSPDHQPATSVSEITASDDSHDGRVELAFRKFPWVERVRRVTYPLKAIHVELDYYEPVAVLPVDQHRQWALDKTAHVLPLDDIDLTKRPLIRIVDKGHIAEVDVKPGLVWKSSDPIKDRKITNAARLAGFLLAQQAKEGEALPPALRVKWIYLHNPPKPDDRTDDLFIVNSKLNSWAWAPTSAEPEQHGSSDEDQWKRYKEAAQKALAKEK